MSEAFFDSIQAALSADGKLGPKVGGSIQFVLTGGHGGDSTWVIDCKQSKVSRGAGKADCTVTLSEENFMALATGKLQGMQAFMAGKMKVKGNMMLAQKLEPLLKAARALAEAGGGAKPAAAAAAAAPASGASSGGSSAFQSAAVFQGIAANLKADPSLIKKVGGVFHFMITGGAGGAKADWTVDAKQSGEVRQAAPPKADCVITISDADMVALATLTLTYSKPQP